MKTASFTLNLITKVDFPEVLAMFKEPDIFIYIKPHQNKSDEAYRDFLNLKLQQTQTGSGFYWLVRDINGELAGAINLTPIPDTGEMQIGWMIKNNYRGRGIAYDAAKMALEFGLEKTEFNPIYGVFEEENIASEKILEKLNFEFHASFMEDDIVLKQYIYRR